MGMGHVPQDPIHSSRTGAELQGRKRRGVAKRRAPRLVQPVTQNQSRAHVARGAWAEQLVARWYEQHQYEIVAMNWSVRSKELRGEIDIIARKDSTLVVCEVKARATNDFGDPLEAITERKQYLLRRTAHEFVRAHQMFDMHLRFDIASVIGTQVEIHFDLF